MAHFPQICRDCGLAPFPVGKVELELVVHRDGGFFCKHIDTVTGSNAKARNTDRTLSMVAYFHKRPARFSGGETQILPFRGEGTRKVKARHNRMLAFPSFAPHEVLPVNVPGDRFADARFTVNCWLHRARSGTA